MFDSAEHYDEELAQGLNLSGEGREFFLIGRVNLLKKILVSKGIPVGTILDFGCGNGHSTPSLQSAFQADVCGFDTSKALVSAAGNRYGSDRVRFVSSLEDIPTGTFDLCYTNGVFHHIEPSDRSASLGQICRVLKRGGLFAFFENNPWNPGTRLVMSRIPFDRDARVISFLEARRLLAAQGFELVVPPQFIFYFPQMLSFFRPLERLGIRIPLGAQYLILGRKT